MQKQSGFTLLELMIAIAILAIIAAIAVPSYLEHTKKARFSEVVQATTPFKLAVSECIQKFGITNMNSCNAGNHGIPAAIMSRVGHIASLSVSGGEITATAVDTDGLRGETYTLTPSFNSGMVVWTASGSAVASGLASN